MTKVVDFFIGSKNKVSNPKALPFNNGSIFMTTLKQKAFSEAGPQGFIYTINLKSIPRSRRLKEDSEPSISIISSLIELSPNFDDLLANEYNNSLKMALNLCMQKSRTGAIIDCVRTNFYEGLDHEFCDNMTAMGFDGYLGRFHPPKNFMTDVEKYFYARIFNFDKITIKKEEKRD